MVSKPGADHDSRSTGSRNGQGLRHVPRLWVSQELESREAERHARYWGNLLLIAIVLACLAPIVVTLTFFSGCVEKAFWVDASPEIPSGVVEMTVQPGALQVNASAPSVEIPERMVSIEVKPGAVQLQVDAPVNQDFQFGKSWVWYAIGAACVALLFAKPVWKWFF